MVYYNKVNYSLETKIHSMNVKYKMPRRRHPASSCCRQDFDEQVTAGGFSESGFTLWEMLFVVAILAVFYGLILTNFSTARVAQNLRSGQNELITTIQKLHSYSLSGRQIQAFSPKFYILKIQAPGSGASTTQYAVQGVAYDSVNDVDRIYDGSANPNLETIFFPQTVSVKEMKLVVKGIAKPDPTCAQIMFSVPYGRAYINENCANLTILYSDIGALGDRANSKLTVTLQRSGTTDERKVVIYGLSGRVEAQ